MTGASGESANLTDMSVLECPICYESLTSPVYQCKNGHIACAPCCSKMANKCPTCRRLIGTICCRAIEMVLESVTFNCPNNLYGCKEKINSNKKKLDHEKTCIYSPCLCPYGNCNYAGMAMSLYKHFSQAHSPSKFSLNRVKSISLDASQTQIFLQDRCQSTLFILNRTIKYPGSFVSVTCVAHDSLCRDFTYHLSAMIDEDTHVDMNASVECKPKWTAEGFSGKCLVLPNDLVDSSGNLDLVLIIRKKTYVRP